MNWIRDNILKVGIILGVLIIIIIVVSIMSGSSSGSNVESASGYEELENKLQAAAIRFVNANSNYLPENTKESTNLNLETLVKNGYIGQIYAIEDSNVKCTGKVTIYRTSNNSDSYKVYPFLLCGKYHKTETLAEHIIENEKIVTSDDGLYKEGDYYRFKGEYPKNYVLLDGQEYRIISIDSDNIIKLIKSESTKSKYIWDDRYNSDVQKYVGINTYTKSRMKDNLNFLYSNTKIEDGEVLFTEEEKSYFVFYDFCNGSFPQDYDEISISTECSSTVNQKIGFINASDFYLASVDSGCSKMNKNECNNYNYLAALDEIVLMNLSSRNSYQYLSLVDGIIYRTDANKGKKLYIVTHISKDNIYKSGDGTKNNPYVIR